MAGQTLTERTDELRRQLAALQLSFEAHRALADWALKQVEVQVAERQKADERLDAKLTELAVKIAAVEEKGRQLEKLSDRSWGLFQAATISALTILAGAVITLVVQLALKK